MGKSVVSISKKHGEHKILSKVTDESIGCYMLLESFIEHLAGELGNPALILTRKQLLQKLREASGRVEEEMKSHTIHVA